MKTVTEDMITSEPCLCGTGYTCLAPQHSSPLLGSPSWAAQQRIERQGKMDRIWYDWSLVDRQGAVVAFLDCSEGIKVHTLVAGKENTYRDLREAMIGSVREWAVTRGR